MATTPQFTATPILKIGQVYTANTNRDGSGSLIDLITGSVNGTKIEHIDIIASGSNSQGSIRFFINNGISTFLIKEKLVESTTATGAYEPYFTSLDFSTQDSQFIIPPNYILKAATYNAEPFNIIIHGGNF